MKPPRTWYMFYYILIPYCFVSMCFCLLAGSYVLALVNMFLGAFNTVQFWKLK